MDKSRFFRVFVLFLMFSLQASSVSVTVILKDDVRVEDDIVVHSLTAFEDLENVTVVDYFSNISSGEVIVEEGFLGRGWQSIKIRVGDLGKGVNKTVSYKVLGGGGEAMLGADVYYLKGERHRLFPVKTTVDVEVEEKKMESRDLDWMYPLLFVLFLVSLPIVYLKLGKRR